MRSPTRRWLAAAAVVLLVGFAVGKRRKIAAVVQGRPWPPSAQVEPWGPQQTQDQVDARKIRIDAFNDCARGAWSFCRQKLDEAKQLDPPGEADPKVQEARQRIEQGTSKGDAG